MNAAINAPSNARINAIPEGPEISEIPQPTAAFLSQVWQSMDGDPAFLSNLRYTDAGCLRSVFAVDALAEAVVGAAGLAIAELQAERRGEVREVVVERRLVSHWFGYTLRPDGWNLPPIWDPIAGDYQAADGWIRLHTNAPHHRLAAQRALGDMALDKDSVAAAVRQWQADDLETAIVANGGCAAAMRSTQQWARHPQGAAVATEPLVHRRLFAALDKPQWATHDAGLRPLAGVRVLDLTRVLAGPVATRFLAGFGADVLRIDPPEWDEPALVPDVTLGKRLARLDLHTSEGRKVLETLIRQADVIVHGYRADALERLGFDEQMRRALNPGLIDVCLNAYGWTGPWQMRRGFDSLLQMSAGIADAGMQLWQRERPTPLPVQALDQATGYLMAAVVIRGLLLRLRTGQGSTARASLARTATLLSSQPARVPNEASSDASSNVLRNEDKDIFCREPEMTEWGRAYRLLAPVQIANAPMKWDRPAASLGSSEARW